MSLSYAAPEGGREIEDIEALERESQGWLDARKYEGLVLAAAIGIVLRDTDLTVQELAVMMRVGKSSMYRWVKGEAPPRIAIEQLWRRLPEIRRDHMTLARLG